MEKTRGENRGGGGRGIEAELDAALGWGCFSWKMLFRYWFVEGGLETSLTREIFVTRKPRQWHRWKLEF